MKRITGTINVNGVNVTIDRIEAGLRNDGVLLNSPSGFVPIGFNHVTFQLPVNNSNYAITSPSRIIANAINQTVTNVQQQLFTSGMTPAQATTQFWARVGNNIAAALGDSPNEKYSFPSDSPVPYKIAETGITITPIYNVPITTNLPGCVN